MSALARVGHAMWGTADRAQSLTAETLSAIALKDYATVESVARALLARAEREPDATSDRLNLPPFFQLGATERFLLITLHSVARWSYARAQRVLGWEGDEGKARLERTLWAARLRLAELLQTAGSLKTYPVGAARSSARCPDFDSRRPWTQRFLDDEIATGTERNFIQNHLMACDGCRRALHAAKEIYYAVDRVLPRPSSGDDCLEITLLEVFEESRILRQPTALTLYRSLERFSRRDDIRLVAVGLALLFLWASFR